MRYSLGFSLLLLGSFLPAAEHGVSVEEAVRIGIGEAKYKTLYENAVERNLPAVLWVNGTCAPCIAKMPNYIHASLREFEGSSEQRVVVCKPQGKTLYKVKEIVGRFPDADEVYDILYPATVSSIPSWSPPQLPYVQPVYYQQPVVQQYRPQYFSPQPQYYARPQQHYSAPSYGGGFGGYSGGYSGGGGAGNC